VDTPHHKQTARRTIADLQEKIKATCVTTIDPKGEAFREAMVDKIGATCVTTTDPQGEAFKEAMRADGPPCCPIPTRHPAAQEVALRTVSEEFKAYIRDEKFMRTEKKQKEAVADQLMAAVDEAEAITRNNDEEIKNSAGINAIEYYQQDIVAAIEKDIVKIRVAIDSAACDNVVDPKELPEDADFEENESGKHLKGANDSHIERYGSCKTVMSSKHGRVGCNWQMAAVSRALHSVGIVAGPKGGPGKQDILFNNEKCYVVAPGIVKKLMETLSAVAEYDREGNLYVGEFTLESFRRQGAQ
jgi:hypothetical protein